MHLIFKKIFTIVPQVAVTVSVLQMGKLRLKIQAPPLMDSRKGGKWTFVPALAGGKPYLSKLRVRHTGEEERILEV